MKLQNTAILMIGLVALPVLTQGQTGTPTATPPPAAAPAAPAVPEMPEMPDIDSVSYAIGMSWGTSLKRNAPDANIDVIAQAMKDVFSSNSVPRFTDVQARQIIQNYQIAYQSHAASKNKKAGEEFLAKNAKEKGVVTLPSGLQYQVITEGTGPTPAATNMVTVHYRGTLIDGTEFDSSFKRNAPTTFGVTGVIPGWTEALQLMKVGSKWKLFIPSNLAYGERGNGNIQPNSALVFEIELLSTSAPVPVEPQAVSGDIIKVPSAEDLKKGAKPEIIKVAPQTK